MSADVKEEFTLASDEPKTDPAQTARSLKAGPPPLGTLKDRAAFLRQRVTTQAEAIKRLQGLLNQ